MKTPEERASDLALRIVVSIGHMASASFDQQAERIAPDIAQAIREAAAEAEENTRKSYVSRWDEPICRVWIDAIETRLHELGLKTSSEYE